MLKDSVPCPIPNAEKDATARFFFSLDITHRPLPFNNDRTAHRPSRQLSGTAVAQKPRFGRSRKGFIKTAPAVTALRERQQAGSPCESSRARKTASARRLPAIQTLGGLVSWAAGVAVHARVAPNHRHLLALSRTGRRKRKHQEAYHRLRHWREGWPTRSSFRSRLLFAIAILCDVRVLCTPETENLRYPSGLALPHRHRSARRADQRLGRQVLQMTARLALLRTIPARRYWRPTVIGGYRDWGFKEQVRAKTPRLVDCGGAFLYQRRTSRRGGRVVEGAPLLRE